jgi:DNA-binding NarL/FixJ family response regulator
VCWCYARHSTAPEGEPHDEARILVADDQTHVRDALKQLIAGTTDLEIVGEARNSRQAIEATSRLRPDVTLLEVSLVESSGAAGAARLKQVCASTRVLALGRGENTKVQGMLEAGASGYLSRSVPAGELLYAIRAVATLGGYRDRRVPSTALNVLASSRCANFSEPLHAARIIDAGQLLEQSRNVVSSTRRCIEASRQTVRNCRKLTERTTSAALSAERTVDQAVAVREQASSMMRRAVGTGRRRYRG